MFHQDTITSFLLQVRHTLSKRKIIPLPTMRANPETAPEALHEPGTTVMAIYPQVHRVLCY